MTISWTMEGAVMWTGAEILDWYRQQTNAGAQP